MTHLLGRIVLMLVVFNIVPVSASTVIDSFNDSVNQIVTADGSNSVETPSAIGGWRMVEIQRNGPLGANATVLSPEGVYTHNADALTSAISKITWDANGAGLGGIDFLAVDIPEFSGSTCFECLLLEIVSIDQGNVDLTIELTDSANNTSAYTATGAAASSFEIAFTNFSGIDLRSIDAISLTIAGSEASDMILDFQGFTGTLVPLPAAGWFFISGLIGFFGLQRKK